LNLSVG